MTGLPRRAVLGGAAGLAAASLSRGALAAAPSFALVQINEQALFFEQLQ